MSAPRAGGGLLSCFGLGGGNPSSHSHWEEPAPPPQRLSPAEARRQSSTGGGGGGVAGGRVAPSDVLLLSAAAAGGSNPLCATAAGGGVGRPVLTHVTSHSASPLERGSGGGGGGVAGRRVASVTAGAVHGGGGGAAVADSPRGTAGGRARGGLLAGLLGRKVREVGGGKCKRRVRVWDGGSGSNVTVGGIWWRYGRNRTCMHGSVWAGRGRGVTTHLQ